ncbi:MAG: VOC family protein [Acidimicrobiia bacterium]|nr:VOC family protein [Acidimicrobiia bacterium]
MTTQTKFRLTGPTIDAADPLRLARFYERLLGWSIVEQEGGGLRGKDAWAKLRSPDGFLKIEIQYEPHYVEPGWPSEPRSQLMMMHLDIGTSDLDAGVAWAEECGAVQAAHQPQDDVRVMMDPEGHPFCLFLDPRA